MAQSVNSISSAAHNSAAAPAQAPRKVIVAARKFNRWYVYFQGVRPADNVGCACKTARSAMRYMIMLKEKHAAIISQPVFDILRYAATLEDAAGISTPAQAPAAESTAEPAAEPAPAPQPEPSAETAPAPKKRRTKKAAPAA